MSSPLTNKAPAADAYVALASWWDRVRAMVAGWSERRRLKREFASLRDRGELERTLSDAGIASSDVTRLLRAHPETPEQLDQMMARLGIDRAALPRSIAVSTTLREMEWRCGECADWHKCRDWLAGRDADAKYRSFCPNAAKLDELRCAETQDGQSSFGQPSGVLAEAATAPREG